MPPGRPVPASRPVPARRKVRKFVRRWRARYPYPDDWVDDRANTQCRRSENAWLARFEGIDVMRRRDVKALVAWRFGNNAGERDAALGGIDGPADWGSARRRIKKALATTDRTAALDLLLGDREGIPGWGPAMASAVLAACRPSRYAVAGERQLRTLRALGVVTSSSHGEFARDDWIPYLRACENVAERSGMSLRSVVQALWAADGAAGSPGPAPRPPKPPRR